MVSRSRWILTHHARAQLAERGISSLDLDKLLERPQWTRPCGDDESKTEYGGYGIKAIVAEEEKVVVTVLLENANKDTWEEVARTRSPKEKPVDREALDSMLARLGVGPSRSTTPRRRAPRQAVTTSHVLDGAATSLHEQARTLAGGDFSRVRVVRPGLIEIDLP